MICFTFEGDPYPVFSEKGKEKGRGKRKKGKGKEKKVFTNQGKGNQSISALFKNKVEENKSPGKTGNPVFYGK